MNHYTSAQYWQNRYLRNSEPFDWYERFYSFKEHVNSNIEIKKTSSVLILGCGTSRLGQQLISQGYSKVINIDFSINCIRKMNEKMQEFNEKLIYQHMDARNLAYQDQSFDGIIDKAMMDSMLCGQNVVENTKKMLNEVYRVLKPKGAYILISYEPPSQKMVYLSNAFFNWKVRVQKIHKQSKIINQTSNNQDEDFQTNHYVYICTKQ